MNSSAEQETEEAVVSRQAVGLSPPSAPEGGRSGCLFCDELGKRVVCSIEAMVDQKDFLERFYRERWRVQDEASASDRLSFTHKPAWEIRACVSCGLLSRVPEPDYESVTNAYINETYDQSYLRSELATQRLWFRSKVPTLMRYLLPVSRRRIPRVLEVGSFVGGFLAEGLAAGWDMLGVDPGRDVVSFCRAQGLPVLRGTIPEAKLAVEFDAAAIWNTFDQVASPDELLGYVAPLLRPGGILVIRIPNGSCFDCAMNVRMTASKVKRSVIDVALAWNNLLTFPYLYGYSVEHIVGLTRRHGFRLKSFHPDTLASAPQGHLKRWAAVEEATVQWLVRLLTSSSGATRMAPWLDLYFERDALIGHGPKQLPLEPRW
ncbi:bifunctional 2-polyprenyl-6-hydroxyphenol methylase/3-demethylubiquinol 3-O-methyltransferase UbiG [Nitrospira sp. KM1]|uniref:class I SAM-dependent methyltransferase n=1 Tax=Nitrospira sp. KM1 TaxID=1936990 RepID=UPI0015659A26|nr:methyltransferase domain-containing protein [Nitrospira sp. KM1]